MVLLYQSTEWLVEKMSPLRAQQGASFSSPSCHSRPTNRLNLHRDRWQALSCPDSKKPYFPLQVSNLPFHEPSHQSLRALPACGGPGAAQSWPSNELQHSFQHTELPRSVRQCWNYSGTFKFTEKFVKVNWFSPFNYWVDVQWGGSTWILTFVSGMCTWASIL